MPKGGTRRSGAKKKPTKIKELQGTDQPCRANELEPKPKEISSADCPEWLAVRPVAKKMWDWTISLLSRTGVLTEADLPTVEVFCVVYSDLQSVSIDLEKAGRVVYTEKMDSDGNQYFEAKANPLVAQLNNLTTQYRMFSSALGLDPASRPSLQVTPKEDEGKFNF